MRLERNERHGDVEHGTLTSEGDEEIAHKTWDEDDGTSGLLPSQLN